MYLLLTNHFNETIFTGSRKLSISWALLKIYDVFIRHSQNVYKKSLIIHIYKITIYYVKALQEGTPEKRKR